MTDQMPHVPVMLTEVLQALAPSDGLTYVDATFGAGGYTRALLEAADCQVVAIDRDPQAIRAGAPIAEKSGGRLRLIEGRFGEMANMVDKQSAHGVVLDIGVSSMQLDDGARGFSFLRDGPLDMRMSGEGATAADAVNTLEADELARILRDFGEEPRARAIARAIVARRAESPITTTFALVAAIARVTGRPRPDRIHPATRTFQALRIHVNRELDELADALLAAESVLAPGGRLAVVTFHSLEDRIVKRFLIAHAGLAPSPSRHAPERSPEAQPSFALLFKGHQSASEAEIRANPRARSAKLRAAIRTSAPPLSAGPN